MERIDGFGFDETVWIEPWIRVGERRGKHDPRADYVERFWLPILGPSTTMFVRYVARAFDALPAGGPLDIGEAARCLGLGERSGRNGPFLRTVARAVDFDMANVIGPGRLAVRRLLPTLSPRQLARLSPKLSAEHQRAVVADVAPNAAAERGRRPALSLLGLGEDVTEVEHQLARWNFHPALAAQCAAWASAQRQLGEDSPAPSRVPARPPVAPLALAGARRALDAVAPPGQMSSDAQ